MAEKAVEAKMQKEEVREVDFWAAKKGTRADVMAGVRYATGWKPGKAVSEKEFDAAVQAFLGASANGRKKK